MSSFREWYDNYLEDLEERAIIAVNDAMSKTWREYFKNLDNKVHEIFNDVVRDFYKGYNPDFYPRRESMKNILLTEVFDGCIKISFDPSKMSFRNGYNGENGLYDQTFRKGWHGGAGSGDRHPDPGTPYWRTWDRRGWGRKAEIANISPLDDIKKRISDYEKYENQADFDKIWEKYERQIKL